MIKPIIFIILSLGIVLGGMDVRVDTRYSPDVQFGGSDQQFANRIKSYVENSSKPNGYCTLDNPSYPIKNGRDCNKNGVSKTTDIGYIWTFTFQESLTAVYEIDFGTDFGGGAAIFVDGVYDRAFQRDFWWAYNWSSDGVFKLNYNFTPGTHTVLVVGNDKCCDGDFSVQFSRNGSPKEPLTKENFGCLADNKCDVTCATNQYQEGRLCKNCNYQCASCNREAHVCRTCSSGTRENAPTCNCKVGFYNVPNQADCIRCHSSCKTCTDGTTCETCESGLYLNGVCHTCESKFGNQCSTCNKDDCLTCKANPTFLYPRCDGSPCTSKEYQAGNSCKPCHPSCKACVHSTSCTQCESNQHFKNGLCVDCTTTYGPKCGTCTPTECLTCKNDPTFTYPDCVKTTCNNGQVQDGQICRNCEIKCSVCDLIDLNKCKTCVSGAFLKNEDCPVCQAPCLACENSALQCTSCIKSNFTVASGCTECEGGHFKTAGGECASCTNHYGSLCGECNQTECIQCKNNPAFKLPTCTSENCPYKWYAVTGSNKCAQCIKDCNVCTNGSTCEQCRDTTYKGTDGKCHPCGGPCFLCKSQTECIVCKDVGWAPPNCNTCGGSYLMNDGKCTQSCPSGQFGNYLKNQCEQCDSSCVECNQKKDKCTKCPEGKVLHNFQCLKCEQIVGMYQKLGAPEGTCVEKCGDGLRVSKQFECDDGNNIDGDGCSADCKIEKGYNCTGGNETRADICVDRRPIEFTVNFLFQSQYLNIEENAPLKCVINFTKQFTLPSGTSLQDFIIVKIPGFNTSGFKVKAKQTVKGRQLQQDSGPSYEVEIQSNATIRKRDMEIDLYPKSAFDDGEGNNLSDSQKPQKEYVNEYFYYNKNERRATEIFEFWLFIGVLGMMVLLPFYVFYYKNHFNRFYILFFVIDITQILYFYRFINIRWPINGIKFFRKLKPTITFYMYNFFKKDIPSGEFEDYSSGVKKFDLEKETALFLNNIGSLMGLFIIFVGLYLTVVLLSQKRLYRGNGENKMYKFFFHLRYGYFQWGIWFDSMLASAGVFLIYVFLQLTNTQDPLNFFLAIGMGVFYIGFFVLTLIHMKRNQGLLYNKEMDEEVEDMPLLEKMDKNPTFKLRNIWHFIHKLEDYPRKAYFYYVYVFRKIYIAIVLLTLQEHPTVQLSMFAFIHLVVILGLFKFTIFKEARDKYRLIISEAFVLGGLGCMYYMLDDVSEDEHFRLKYSWFAISSLLLGLFVHAAFFIYSEVILPIIEYCLKKNKSKKVTDLRQSRKEGKQASVFQSEATSLSSKFGHLQRKKLESGDAFKSDSNIPLSTIPDSFHVSQNDFAKEKSESNGSNSPKDKNNDFGDESTRHVLPSSNSIIPKARGRKIRKLREPASTRSISNFSQFTIHNNDA